jgi:predicted O-methyltransferase YrrM
MGKNQTLMYTRTQLARKYIHYLLHAKNGRGHGIHSPFVYAFTRDVLNDHTKYTTYGCLEEMRMALEHDSRKITIEDFGAGSSKLSGNTRSIGAIARSSLKPRKFAQLLYRIVHQAKPRYAVELGTSLGITTAYMASAYRKMELHSLEGSTAIAQVALKNIGSLGLDNVYIHTGDFADTLQPTLGQLPRLDFAFVDGNHRKEPTLQYFRQLLDKTNEQSLIIFDDIHWSEEMEEAWEEIKSHPRVTLTIDLFFIGLVYFRREFKVKQDFTIRF